MKTSFASKSALIVAWCLTAMAIYMLLHVTDTYPGGYERMLRHSFGLFALSGTLGLAVFVWALRSRKKKSALPMVWTVCGGLHVALSLIISLIVWQALSR